MDEDEFGIFDYDSSSDMLSFDYDEIACASPSSQNASETLRYTKRAKIKNKPVIRMDPREELILKLQREMNSIKQENVLLRSQLEFPHRDRPRFPHPGDIGAGDGHPMQQILPQINQHRVKPNERPATENNLYGMLQEYMVENEALRNQNESLMTQHSNDEREMRIITRDNDRLHVKLEGLQRLVLTSSVGKNGYSRITSGHSYMSLNSYDPSMTPISQAFAHNHPVFGPNGINYPKYAIHQNPHPHRKPQAMYPNHHHPHQTLPPWEHAPNGNGELPPLNNSSPLPRKQPDYGNHQGLPQQENNQSKWNQGRSYAKQLQGKPTWHRISNPRGNNDVTKIAKQRNEVMSDLPSRDLSLPRQQEQLHGQARISPPQNRGFHQNVVNNYINAVTSQRSPPMQPRIEGALQNQGALPQDSYKARNLSPRSSITKELSATSLRRMNNKMRQDMQALDDQIHYERIKHRPS